jgi:L-threonylcarbamoyladenylate synthase
MIKMHNDLKKATEVLRNGGIILFPTDTVWSLGCDATHAGAVQKMQNILNLQDSENMVVLMENPALLERYVAEVPEIAWDLVEISTTPLTIIFPNAKNLAPNLLTGDGSIGIRFTKEEFSMQLLQRFRRPVVSVPACNKEDGSSGSFNEIPEEIRSQADYIVEYRQEDLTPAESSSVIKLWPGGRIEILSK